MLVYTLANYGRQISIEIYILWVESLPEATWGIGIAGQTPAEVGAFNVSLRLIPIGTTALTGFLLESGGYNFDPKEISDGSRAEQSFGAS